MNIRDIIKAAISFRGYTQDQAAKRSGWENGTAIHYLVNKPKLNVDAVFQVLDSLEYEIIIKDKKSNQYWKVEKM